MNCDENTFLDDDIKVDEKLFDNFPIDTLSCWAHLELWATIHNIPIDKNFVKFITVGSVYSNVLYDIILDAIKTTNFLNEHINDINFIELLYKLYTPLAAAQIYSAKNKWIAYMGNNRMFESKMWNGYTPTEYLNRKYAMLTTLDTRFPTLLISFYNKNARILHSIDETFVIWLFERCKIKADYSNLFAKIYDAMSSEAQKQRNIKMHLN